MKKNVMMLLILFLFVMTAAPQSAANFYNAGVDALNGGDYTAAVENFKAAALADPAHLEARLGLGQAYFKLNQWNNAEIALKEASNLAPDNADALDLLSKAFYMNKEYGDAAAVLEKLIALRPDAGAYSLLGKSCYNLEDFKKSADAFAKSLEMGSTDTSDYRRLANAYYKLYKSLKDRAYFDKAIDVLDKAVVISAEADSYYLKGKFLYFMKKYEPAAEALKAAAAMHTDDNTLFYLSKSLYLLKEYDEALIYGKKLLSVKSGSKAYALLGDICRDSGMNSEASEYYRQGAAYSDKSGQYCAQYYKYMQSQGQ